MWVGQGHVFVGTALAALTASGVLAQPAEVPLVVRAELASFERAAALAADASGRLYVLDGEAGTITKLDTAGNVLAVWGGAGSGAYAFDQPADMDPTSGLMLWVADSGNRLLKRYSGEFLHLESLALDLTTTQAVLRRGGGIDGLEGRPVGVRVSLDGDVYALDEERAVVVKWNAARRVERVIGGYDAGDGGLVRPVALDLGRDGSLYVADPGRGEVVVFDRFGTFLRTLAAGLAREVVRVRVFGSRVFIVLPGRILVYDRSSGLRRVYVSASGEPLRDVTVAEGTLFVLTPTRLLAVRL